jgi:hypothetical protein
MIKILKDIIIMKLRKSRIAECFLFDFWIPEICPCPLIFQLVSWIHVIPNFINFIRLYIVSTNIQIKINKKKIKNYTYLKLKPVVYWMSN